MKACKTNKLFLCAMAVVLALAGAGTSAFSSKAADVYTVEVVPCYQHPVTGVEEDTGHNPGLGQAMCEAQVQTQGLVEIEDDGSIWLTARWNMVDTQTNVSFNIQTWGDSGWTPVDYEIVRQVQDEYVVTDFRIQLNSLDDIVRATNYVEPMGREVIFYYYLQNLTEGAGDFETNVQSANVDTLVASMQEAEAEESAEAGTSGGTTSSGSSSSGNTTTTTKKATGSTSGTDTTKSISKKEAKKTSSADELLDSATGIDGEESAAKTTQTDNSGSEKGTNAIVLAAATAGGAAGGALLGGGIVAAVAASWFRKRQERDNVYAEIDSMGDDRDEER